ncbi:MAG TPA: LysR family transcriptional regulator [Casimicrobiaceae bacterium]
MSADKLIERLPRRLKMGELRVFVAVLEHRSFRKAATALHVTQPAVTKAIAGLEDMLEVKLFDRKADGIEPTVHGLAFAPHAIAIFGELRSAAQELAIVSSGAKGTLHIGTVPMPGVAFLPIAIKALVDDHPDIFVSVIEARESDLAERLRKREIEIAILRSAMFIPGDDLRVDALFEERLCVLASRDHPLATRQRVTWRELLEHPWVLPPADSPFFDHVRRSLDQLGIELPRHVVESISIAFQYGMVLHGAMLSFGLRSQLAFSPHKDFLVQLPVDLPSITRHVGAVTLHAREPNPLAKQLIEKIRCLIADL